MINLAPTLIAAALANPVQIPAPPMPPLFAPQPIIEQLPPITARFKACVGQWGVC